MSVRVHYDGKFWRDTYGRIYGSQDIVRDHVNDDAKSWGMSEEHLVEDKFGSEPYRSNWNKAQASYTTKDSGTREEFDSGMHRDTQEGKARFDLLVPEGVPYKAQLLTRFAELMERGARKYTERNWELANSEDELNRAKSSAIRHFMQWFTGEDDEDHAAAVLFNLMVAETVKHKLSQS